MGFSGDLLRHRFTVKKIPVDQKVQQDQHSSVKCIFHRNGSYPKVHKFICIIPHHFFFDPASGKDAIHKKERNQKHGIHHIKSGEPIDLQDKFSGIIMSIIKQKELTQKSIEKSEGLFQSLLQRAFKGNL